MSLLTELTYSSVIVVKERALTRRSCVLLTLWGEFPDKVLSPNPELFNRHTTFVPFGK